MSGAENPMSDPRPAASLSASLLARRGAARPAMRRQPVAGVNGQMHLHDDLGWNDMGDETPATPSLPPVAALVTTQRVAPSDPAPVAATPAAGPAPTPIDAQIQAIAERINARPEPKSPRRAPPANLAGLSRKAAFTLRLDAERHLRLRLLSAVSKQSAQQLLVQALDALIAGSDQVQRLAAQVEEPPRAAGQKRGS